MSTEASVTTTSSSGPGLRRTLTLWDLILYGVIVIQPVAPMSVFGVLSDRGHGHVVTAILIAMVAMLFTGISYGRMARAYPSAGSAFTYVAQEIHPGLGYVTGWSMVMDYMLNPLICTIWCAQQAHAFAPGVPVWSWKIFFAVVFTLLNIRGIKTSARVNTVMAIAMGAVVCVVIVAAARYIFGHPHNDPAFFLRPFYDPQTFSYSALFGCTSIAVLTYIGFDGISTLSEEAENPRRNILLATVLTCIVIGVSVGDRSVRRAVDLAGVREVSRCRYRLCLRGRPGVGAAVPDCRMDAAAREFRFRHGRAAWRGAAVVWDGPQQRAAKSFFGVVDEKNRVPRNNVIFIGVIVLIGAFFLNYGLGAEMLNFGALIAFMGVNAAAFLRYFRARTGEKSLESDSARGRLRHLPGACGSA